MITEFYNVFRQEVIGPSTAKSVEGTGFTVYILCYIQGNVCFAQYNA
jgi:hypothetical protein